MLPAWDLVFHGFLAKKGWSNAMTQNHIADHKADHIAVYNSSEVFDKLSSFWNNSYEMTDEEKMEESKNAGNPEEWNHLAPSKKLFDAAASLGNACHVLDYGCGSGWAGIIAAKSGCRQVTCVDITQNGTNAAAFYADLFGVSESVKVQQIEENWLSQEPDEKYDGFFCSNVIDVIPAEYAEEILRQSARVVTKDAGVIIGLNYYMQPKPGADIRNGNQLYIDDVLRLVNRTDEEWSSLFQKYFTIEKLDHFAWPGEATETRRLFFLRKKQL